MSALAAAAAKHARAVNERAGEPLRLRPQRATSLGGAGGGDDPARAAEAVAFTGTVTRRPVLMQRVGQGAQGGTNAQFTDAKWQLGFPAGSIRTAGGAPVTPRAGDHVERLAPVDGEPATLRLYAPLSIRGRTIHPADPV